MRKALHENIFARYRKPNKPSNRGTRKTNKVINEINFSATLCPQTLVKVKTSEFFHFIIKKKLIDFISSLGLRHANECAE